MLQYLKFGRLNDHARIIEFGDITDSGFIWIFSINPNRGLDLPDDNIRISRQFHFTKIGP